MIQSKWQYQKGFFFSRKLRFSKNWQTSEKRDNEGATTATKSVAWSANINRKESKHIKRTLWENMLSSILWIIFNWDKIPAHKHTHTNPSHICLLCSVCCCCCCSTRNSAWSEQFFFTTSIWHIQYGWMSQCN